MYQPNRVVGVHFIILLTKSYTRSLFGHQSVWHLSSFCPPSGLKTHVLFLSSCSLCISKSHLLADNIKVQYLQFMAYMKTPQYRTNLQQLLEEEKVTCATTDISLFHGYTCFFECFHILNSVLHSHILTSSR